MSNTIVTPKYQVTGPFFEVWKDTGEINIGRVRRIDGKHGPPRYRALRYESGTVRPWRAVTDTEWARREDAATAIVLPWHEDQQHSRD